MKDIGFTGLSHSEMNAFTSTLTKSDSDMVFLESSTFLFFYSQDKNKLKYYCPRVDKKVLSIFKRRAVIIAPLWFSELNQEGQVPNHTSVLVVDNKRKCTYLIDYGFIGAEGVKAVFAFFKNLIPKKVGFIVTNGFNRSFMGRKPGKW